MENEIIYKIVLDTFSSTIKRASKLIESFSDEQLSQEVSASKNTGHYLLGHLIAVHDNMLPLLGFGESLYPELLEIFVKNPDKSELPKPSIEQLRTQWNEVNNTVLSQLKSLTPTQWLAKHTAVSDEDFAKEPHRNKLNVVLSRTNHLSYHLGQIGLLKN
ncbi:DinB family protein [Flavobacterium marginilacus]|uniref:DinB family protein n=1 Tax=Flavobacterium marginilacus TaxID=3003256 RepID=UPI00248E07EB|nr:DinB family protein [Flavobacterium marginilacus]